MSVPDRSTRMQQRRRSRAAELGVLALTLGLLVIGCAPGNKEPTVEQKIDLAVKPIRDAAEEQKSLQGKADRDQTDEMVRMKARIDQLEKDLASRSSRLETAEKTIADYQRKDEQINKDIRAVDARVDNAVAAHDAHVKDFAKRFSENAEEHARFVNEDQQIRQTLNQRVTDLDSKTTANLANVRSELIERFEEDRGVVLTAFRGMEDRSAAEATRMVMAMRMIQDFLMMQRKAAQSNAEQLDAVIAQVERSITGDDAKSRADLAAGFFKEAQRLHQGWLADRKQTAQLDDAILNYRKGLALQPDAVESHLQLARLLRDAGRSGEAQRHFQYYGQNGKDEQGRREADEFLRKQRAGA